LECISCVTFINLTNYQEVYCEVNDVAKGQQDANIAAGKQAQTGIAGRLNENNTDGLRNKLSNVASAQVPAAQGGTTSANLLQQQLTPQNVFPHFLGN
jgi:hypothetical protein